MRPCGVVVSHIVLNCGERSHKIFSFVRSKPTFYFAVGLWTVDSCKHVFDAKSVECDAELSVFLRGSRMVGIVGAAVVSHDCFWLAVLADAGREHGKCVVRCCVFENAERRYYSCFVVNVGAEFLISKRTVRPVGMPQVIWFRKFVPNPFS